MVLFEIAHVEEDRVCSLAFFLRLESVVCSRTLHGPGPARKSRPVTYTPVGPGPGPGWTQVEPDMLSS